MRLDCELVETCGIEPQSKTKRLLTSTCLEKLFEFNLASHYLQSYTRRASKFILGRDKPKIYLHKG